MLPVINVLPVFIRSPLHAPAVPHRQLLAMRHVPPRLPFIFSGHFRAAQTFDPCGCLSIKIYWHIALSMFIAWIS